MKRQFVGLIVNLVSVLLILGLGYSFSGLVWHEMKVYTSSNITLNVIKCSGENIIWVGSYPQFLNQEKLCVLRLESNLKNSSETYAPQKKQNNRFIFRFGPLELMLCVGIGLCLYYLSRQ